MAWWKFWEARNIQDPTKNISATDFADWLMGDRARSAADVIVSIDSALGVPAVWQAVNFLSKTMASLPLNVYRETKGTRTVIRGGTGALLHDNPNPETTSFDWRSMLYLSVFKNGRGYCWIERDLSGRVISIWNLPYNRVTVKRENSKLVYEYDQGGGVKKTYPSQDIIDIVFHWSEDNISHINPLRKCADAIGLAIAASDYGSKFFAGGGVPPFVVQGKFSTEKGLLRAGEDLREATRKAAKEKRVALTMPEGLEFKSIGVEPEKTQLNDLQRFSIEQVARIYGLPPVFLQDLTKGTYANTEQQDIQLVKHTIRHWATQFEQQINLKLFGFNIRTRFAEFALDALLRGAFKDRMTGYQTAISGGIMKPHEARDLENLPRADGDDKLYLQSGTQPIDSLGQNDGND